MKFLIVQLPPFSRHLIPLRSKYSSQNPVSNTLSLYFSLSVRDQVSHQYQTTGRIVVLYILTFTFLDEAHLNSIKISRPCRKHKVIRISYEDQMVNVV
jgi:hypothetical protein